MTYPEVGQEYEFGEGSFTVLGPTQIRDDSNNNSVVVRLDYGDTSFLFTGDAESKEEKDIIAANEDLYCDVTVSRTSWFCKLYKLGFSGSRSSGICSYFLWCEQFLWSSRSRYYRKIGVD